MKAWGKIDSAGARHALSAHCSDVAAVFQELMALPAFCRASERTAGGALSDAAITRLSALAWIHDIGKLHPHFQAKATGDHQPISHSAAGMGLLTCAFRTPDHPLRGLVTQLTAGDAAIMPYLTAIFAHHGKPVGQSHDTPRLWPGENWRIWAEDFATAFGRAFPDLTAAPLPKAPAFVHLFTGLLALSDWIGSDRDFFAFDADPAPDYHDRARQQARKTLRITGLDTTGLNVAGDDFATLTGFEPRSVQSLVPQIPLESALAIIEAETGSGKTEAALWYFARLFAAGAVSGLYFAVPTRAAARQLHGRLCKAMHNLFGDSAPEPILAIPEQRVAGEAHGRALPDFVTVWDDAEAPVKSRWAAEHATRFLAATVAVGTVDQAMLAAMQVKHAHLRGAALTRSLLVIDEVHASDRYMTAINQSLLKAHLGAGGRALLMSATLGSEARAAYLGQTAPDLDDACAAPFPALWAGGRALTIAPEADKTVRIATRSSMSAEVLAAEAIAAARAGARVLVIRNTVGAAIDVWRAVRDAGEEDLLMQVAGTPALHHSRFAAEDRALLDAAAEAVLSPKREAGRGCIVIGSQTLEQSLDIDADFLLTDLCPMDVLLQRLGRLHRHKRARPAGFEQAQALVFAPEAGLEPLAKPGYENGLGAWEKGGAFEGIYLDLPVLALTQELIEARPEWRIPSMNRELVEQATHAAPRAMIVARKGDNWQRYETQIAGKAAAARMAGQMAVLDRSRPMPEKFRSDDQSVMTRLGEIGPVIDLPPGTIGAFGTEITRMGLPAHWARGLEDDLPEVQRDGGDLLISVGDRRFRYGREGLVRVAEQ